MIHALSDRLLPDNFSPDPPIIQEGSRYLTGVLNPRGTRIQDKSVRVGLILDEEGWGEPGEAVPDGSYAIFRNGNRHTECITDRVASRTIWYGGTEELFVASTLQRAIVCFLRSYTPNPEAHAWMVSAGILGPFQSWAQEIKQLRPQSLLRLDRDTWELDIDHRPISFEKVSGSRDEHYSRMVGAIEGTMGKVTASPATDVLTLSGGYDSRGLLHHLSEKTDTLQTLTWGREGAPKINLNDAEIAQRLADHYGTEHQFKALDTRDLDLGTVIERFVTAGEGRIDHLSGYLDGLRVWSDIHAGGVERVLRGDEGFGWVPPITAFTQSRAVRRSVGCIIPADYSDRLLGESLAVEIPDGLRRQQVEGKADWRDRLYHAFRLPIVMAALNSVKSSYCEVANPLLTGPILSRVRELPGSLRDDKALFKEYIDSISPDVPYARFGANPSLRAFLWQLETIDYLESRLEETRDQSVLPTELVDHVHAQLRTEGTPPGVEADESSRKRESILKSIKQYAPRTLVDFAKRWANDSLSPDYHRLALRIVIAGHMNEMLRRDAQVFA
jgi:hypothetical protein